MSDHKTMTLTLIVWRQKNANDPGKFETYTAKNITEHHSFLEMLDCVNEDLINAGKEPIVFDHDCREGYLRHVLTGGQRRAAWRAGADHRLPAAHA